MVVDPAGNLYLSPLYSMFRDAQKQSFQENGEYCLSIVC
jgi:hypothetical protein